MKKIISLLILLFVLTTLQAQFGIKGGVNIANWGGEDVDDIGADKSSKIGFYGGLFYNAAFADMFSVQPELVFSTQGAKFEDLGIEVKFNLAYMNFTPLLRWNHESGFFLGTAPQVGFLLSAKSKVDSDEEDIKDDLKGVDFAWVLAAGYEMESGFGFYARYNHGLSTLDDADTDASKVFNRVFQIGLRYAFNKGSK